MKSPIRGFRYYTELEHIRKVPLHRFHRSNESHPVAKKYDLDSALVLALGSLHSGSLLFCTHPLSVKPQGCAYTNSVDVRVVLTTTSGTPVTHNWELEARQLSKQFPDGTYALQDINWAVKQGETMALIGESGSGKTTLLRLLNRLTEPSSGQIFIQGLPARHQNPITLRRQLGYIPQDGGLFPHWTIQRNVCLVPQLLGWPIDQQHERFNDLLPLVNLDPSQIADRYPIELSGGQRQRVAVARALAADPPIVLLDEPFSALDPLTRHELHEQFLVLKTTLHKTMVVITHDMAEAFRLGDRITVLKDGHIHQMGTPQELIDSPATPYVTSLVEHRLA